MGMRKQTSKTTRKLSQRTIGRGGVGVAVAWGDVGRGAVGAATKRLNIVNVHVIHNPCQKV